MSIPPLPSGVEDSEVMQTANALHSLCIHILRRASQADRESGLSAERLSILSVLTYVGPQSIGGLAEIEGVSAPAISRHVSELGKLGLTKSNREKRDARSVKVSITRKGMKLVEKGRRRRLEIVAGELSGLNTRVLKKVQEASRLLRDIDDRAK